MYDDRYTRRYNRRMNRYRNPMRGLATGIFFIFLAFAFYFSKSFDSHLFLPILFAGLALCCLFGAASSGDPRGIYGGLYPFVWLLGLALCFLIGFWPWILLPIGVSMILGALYNPITTGLASSGFMANQPPPQQYQQTNQPSQAYEQGYQAPPPTSGTYQEGGQQYQYPPQPKQQYDLPETDSAQQQELPPQQQ
ncbi:MAG TPA: hypothetical protein VN954_05335 [Ktedonobacteraceae bacterium]|nr:hypothetical protein [Ktedonobacteraceae bacterium]